MRIIFINIFKCTFFILAKLFCFFIILHNNYVFIMNNLSLLLIYLFFIKFVTNIIFNYCSYKQSLSIIEIIFLNIIAIFLNLIE